MTRKEIPHVYLLADIHGNFRPVRDFYQRNPQIAKAAARHEKNILILLGDTGLNYFFNHRDEELKKALGRYPFVYFAIRGNHEQRPSILANENLNKWHKEPFWDWEVWVENNYPYIKYAMDYVAFYNIPYEIEYCCPENPEDDDIGIPLKYRTIVIPGAYSVDKYHRLQMGWSWFPEEQLSKSEMEAGKSLLNSIKWQCDLVLSHTCPIIYEPTDLFLSMVNQSMVDKTMERYLGEIEYKLNYKLWAFGHYHKFREYPRNIEIPSFKDPRQIMLFNDYAVELEDVMTNIYSVNRL